VDVITEPAPVRTARRLPGPDVVRAVALIGVVVMNYHGYLVIAGDRTIGGGFWDEVFHPWSGPLSTRFAATFVLTAGVGVTLLTRSASDVGARRWTLLRRGLALFLFGWFVNHHWPGSILPYYGALFMLAAGLFALPSLAVLAIGMTAAVAGAAIAWWGLERVIDGHDISWLRAPDRWTSRGLALDTFVNGTHPLLPWLMFFCAGIVLGRLLTKPWWRSLAAGVGLTLFGLATLISGAIGPSRRADTLASTDPFDRGLLYTASALGTALAAFAAVSWLADRWPRHTVVEAFRHAGAMTLTLYLAHIVVYKIVVDHLGWVRPAGLGAALAFAAVFWLVAIVAAAWYHRRVGIGPAEWIYRKIGG